MPSPIAHAISGYAIARLFPFEPRPDRGSPPGILPLLFGLFVALAPDLDFIPQIITGERYHHGFTHSLAFAIGFTVIVWLLSYFWLHQLSVRLFLMTLIIYGSHLFLDIITIGGPGIQLLWPFTEEPFKSSWAIFPETHHSSPLFQHPGHIIFITFELSYAVILLGSIWFWYRKNGQPNHPTSRKKLPPASSQESAFQEDSAV